MCVYTEYCGSKSQSYTKRYTQKYHSILIPATSVPFPFLPENNLKRLFIRLQAIRKCLPKNSFLITGKHSQFSRVSGTVLDENFSIFNVHVMVT